jgi:hypothetical protein
MKFAWKVSVCTLSISLALSVWADTVKFKSGKVLQGSFMGGDTRQIKFADPDGQTNTYSLTEVDSLTFAPLPEAPKPAAPVTPASAPTQVTIPAGAQLLVRMVDTLDTSKTDAGQRFTATLDTNLEANGVIAAPKGTTVYGKVLQSNSAGRAAGKSKMSIQLTEIVLDGTARPIVTDVFDTEGKGSGGRTARRTLGGAGLGAAIGAIGGNAGKGAAIGATAGGVLSVVQKGDQVQIPSEAQLEFRLQQPITLPAAK